MRQLPTTRGAVFVVNDGMQAIWSNVVRSSTLKYCLRTAASSTVPSLRRRTHKKLHQYNWHRLTTYLLSDLEVNRSIHDVGSVASSSITTNAALTPASFSAFRRRHVAHGVVAHASLSGCSVLEYHGWCLGPIVACAGALWWRATRWTVPTRASRGRG